MKKIFLFSSVILLFIAFIVSCVEKKAMIINKNLAFNQNNLNKYKLVVVDNSNVYELKNSRMSADTILGDLVKMDDTKNGPPLNAFNAVAAKTEPGIEYMSIYMNRQMTSPYDTKAPVTKSCAIKINEITNVTVGKTSPAPGCSSSNLGCTDGCDNGCNTMWIGLKVIFIVGLILLIGGIAYIFNSPGNSGACYVATMAYGNYDAPEVLVLRKFRDEKLMKSFFGKVFIAAYYSFSPGLVAVVKNMPRTKALIKRRLDKLVDRLK